MREKKKQWKLVALLASPLIILFGAAALAIGRATAEQLTWYPRDAESLDVLSIQYAQEGILLKLHAPSGVEEVWRQHAGPTLFRPYHYKTEFFTGSSADGEETLLVPYDFSADGEWLLALKTNDGHWESMSPYFPAQPELTPDKWRELLSTATRNTPR